MGFFNRLFGKQESEPEEKEGGSLNLAFVLLSEARLPEAEAIIQAFREFASSGANLQAVADDSGEDVSKQVISFALNTGENLLVALMPVAVPNGEADDAVRHSLSSFRN